MEGIYGFVTLLLNLGVCRHCDLYNAWYWESGCWAIEDLVVVKEDREDTFQVIKFAQVLSNLCHLIKCSHKVLGVLGNRFREAGCNQYMEGTEKQCGFHVGSSMFLSRRVKKWVMFRKFILKEGNLKAIEYKEGRGLIYPLSLESTSVLSSYYYQSWLLFYNKAQIWIQALNGNG